MKFSYIALLFALFVVVYSKQQTSFVTDALPPASSEPEAPKPITFQAYVAPQCQGINLVSPGVRFENSTECQEETPTGSPAPLFFSVYCDPEWNLVLSFCGFDTCGSPSCQNLTASSGSCVAFDYTLPIGSLKSVRGICEGAPVPNAPNAGTTIFHSGLLLLISLALLVYLF